METFPLSAGKGENPFLDLYIYIYIICILFIVNLSAEMVINAAYEVEVALEPPSCGDRTTLKGLDLINNRALMLPSKASCLWTACYFLMNNLSEACHLVMIVLSYFTCFCFDALQ